MVMGNRIAYLGPAGTFTEQAALQYSMDAVLEPFPSVASVAMSVSSGTVNEGVVPIENSLEGSVTATLDLLIQESSLFIRRELVLPIEHCLLVKPGTRAADIQVVYSHPQALGQCRGFLEQYFPLAQLEASLSTVAAADVMLDSAQPAAAIASRHIADLREVEILAQNIQDTPFNVTRFVVLALQDHPPTGSDKTSLCFSFADDKAGLLYEVMGEFSRNNINLAKVESRPAKQALGEYVFLIDCDGHREDSAVRETLEALRPKVAMLKIFGSYPRWRQE